MDPERSRTAIVTGGSRGLGKVVAIELARTGANVVVNYRTHAEEAEATVAAITADGGVARAVQADVGSAADVARLYAEAIAHFGRVDILVNNAGIMRTALLKDTDEREFEAHFNTNVKSVFLMMKAAAEHVQEGGRIVNISSSTTRLMMPGYAVYSATKAAVEQMTRVFAKEIGAKRITVNSILPGPMSTELFLQGKSEELIQRIAAQSAFNRIGNVEDIVPALLFLCSEEAQWITGQSFGVNGGMA